MWGNIKKTTNIFFVLTLQHKRNRKNPCWFYDIIQNTTTVTTNIIVYHSITNFMNNKYLNYITLQQYASDPTNQQKKKKKAITNLFSTIYHILQSLATISLNIFLLDVNFDKSIIGFIFFLYPLCLQNFDKINNQ